MMALSTLQLPLYYVIVILSTTSVTQNSVQAVKIKLQPGMCQNVSSDVGKNSNKMENWKWIKKQRITDVHVTTVRGRDKELTSAHQSADLI